jgi:hypothetical protein
MQGTHGMTQADDLQYVSLMTTPFSGCTLLSMLLCSQPRSIGVGDTYFGRASHPDDLCTCGVSFLQCQPRLEAQSEIRRGGPGVFSWATATAVPTPKWVSVDMRKYWPLSNSLSLAAIRAIPPSIRTRMFRRYYLENRLMLSGLAKTGRYDYYFDGCKEPVRLECFGRISPVQTEYRGNYRSLVGQGDSSGAYDHATH